MRLLSRLFVFVSSLFVVLYGVLPGLFKIEGEFVSAFVAGSNFLKGVDPAVVYRFPLFQRLIDSSGFTGKMFPFAIATPSSIMAAAALAIPQAAIARFALTAANIVAFVVAVHATAKLAGASTRTTYSIFLSSSFALAANFQSSQPMIILTSLIVLAFYAYSIGSTAACGAFLGLAFPFNPFLGIPAVLFLLSTKWRAFAYFVTTAAGILLLTYLIVGQSTLIYYFQRILPAYMNGKVLDPFSNSFQTAWSFFRRAFLYNETLNTNPIFRSATAYALASSAFKAAIVVPPAYFFYKGISAGKPREALAAASFPVVFLLPALSSPELFLLAPAIVILSQAALEEGQRKTAAAFMVLYALTCIPFYSFIGERPGFLNIVPDYEQLFFLVAIYVVYLLFQTRVVPHHFRALRLALTTLIIAAVTLTLYLGDRYTQHENSLPLKPALAGAALGNVAFSPGLSKGHISYVTYDSATAVLVPDGIAEKEVSPQNVYRYSSGRSGRNYATETVRNGSSVVQFKTRAAEAAFDGHSACVSIDEDYGAFLRNGTIYVLDLDPRYISPVDTLALLPFKIRLCSFNNSENNEIVFLIDSLNSSYSIGTYNLFSRRVATLPLPFIISNICASGDSFFLTQEVADSTILWKLVRGTPLCRLLTLRGNIYDISFLKQSLLISSDFERGLYDPTIYRYLDSANTSSKWNNVPAGVSPNP